MCFQQVQTYLCIYNSALVQLYPGKQFVQMDSWVKEYISNVLNYITAVNHYATISLILTCLGLMTFGITPISFLTDIIPSLHSRTIRLQSDKFSLSLCVLWNCFLVLESFWIGFCVCRGLLFVCFLTYLLLIFNVLICQTLLLIFHCMQEIYSGILGEVFS